MKCIGNCFPHTGRVQRVTIHAHGMDSLPMEYCQSAIQADIDKGFRVKIIPSNFERNNALWLAVFLACLVVFAWLL
jgi:hypothetical protein